jgi:hypothetical protein
MVHTPNFNEMQRLRDDPESIEDVSRQPSSLEINNLGVRKELLNDVGF